jgi:hypothetical protein
LSLQIPSGSPHTNFWLLYSFKVQNIVFFWKIFVLIGIFGVPIIFLGFWVEPANFVGQPPYEFLAPLHFSGTKLTFFGNIFVLIGRFGVPIIFFGFWVEPANSVG